MGSWLRTILVAGATVTLLSTAAAAACTTGSLAGRWDSYTSGTADGDPFWERCVLRIDANGRLGINSDCRTDTGEGSTITGGFILNSFCRATGVLTQQFPGEPPNPCTLVQGTLTQDQQVLSGVGTCKGSKSIFSLTMIRH